MLNEIEHELRVRLGSLHIYLAPASLPTFLLEQKGQHLQDVLSNVLATSFPMAVGEKVQDESIRTELDVDEAVAAILVHFRPAVLILPRLGEVAEHHFLVAVRIKFMDVLGELRKISDRLTAAQGWETSLLLGLGKKYKQTNK